MEALTICISIVAAVALIGWVSASRETRHLNRELQSAWAALQLSMQTHSMSQNEMAKKHAEQLHDLAITLNAQAKAASAHEAIAVHHAVQAGRAEPEPIEKVPPPVRGIKLREGLEIDFITPPTEAQMAEVDEEMVLR